MKQEHLLKLKESGIVAVVRGANEEIIEPLAEALAKGGVYALEITMDSEDGASMIKKARELLGDSALIGAGTVLDSITAKRAIEAGAAFIFSPNLDIETVKMTKRYNKISIPGVMTPTEVLQAYEAGADIVKVFPASVVGPAFFKDVRGPLPFVDMMPTGGVTIDNVQEFIKAGACAVGLGSALVDIKLAKENRYDEITERAKAFKQKIDEARQS
ncbi:bifunctional 4-hydroxy-2-oxoglutarate aldolase/2-dehydro-3-deoxy-phosphogluconate aldolase [Aureibacillus halotolerans]|uniref:2-keto-3-deoxy-phosphogluconate aldolase n=1 Tax=Aureibacillus halotolerans TaxID=1508390 RepID=A0A4R6UGB4_9BACI|nr:bifunctional 4-hydroxy-2-oxoglutarate aldolase/2-dehydro-3-deoxy-phosphogluconate aldolase [Aureibacillus halotolerans]TDQ42184.1 2-keto-3-deoxy-phosphogluconate aldolase [Aureibacillus halotolerans]